MGMDVFGKNPSKESGEYFRATIWSWPVIHREMATGCRDFLSEELLKAMEYNDGAGPDDQAVCEKIADRLEDAMKATVDCTIAQTCRVDLNSVEAHASVGEAMAKSQDYAYRSRNAMFAEWIEFLRHCGGFAVW